MGRPLIALLNTDPKERAIIAGILGTTYDIIEFESPSDLMPEFRSLSYRIRVVIYCLNQKAKYTHEQLHSFIEISTLPDFIVVSEQNTPNERQLCIDAGASEYVQDITTLDAIIEQSLALSRFRKKMEHLLIHPLETGHLVPVVQEVAHADLRDSALTAISNGYSVFMKDIYRHFPQIKTLQIPSETAIPSSLINSSEKLQLFVNQCLCSVNATSA